MVTTYAQAHIAKGKKPQSNRLHWLLRKKSSAAMAVQGGLQRISNTFGIAVQVSHIGSIKLWLSLSGLKSTQLRLSPALWPWPENLASARKKLARAKLRSDINETIIVDAATIYHFSRLKKKFIHFQSFKIL